MNNEIKKILDKWECYIGLTKKFTTNEYEMLRVEDVDKILNYITNLQQEIKEANDSITWWTNRFKAVERDNRELQQRITGLEAENETLRSDFKNQVEYTNKIVEENERLNKRNEEIYKGYMSVVDELTEYAKENERLKKEIENGKKLFGK